MKKKIDINSVFLFKLFGIIVTFAGVFTLALCQFLIIGMYQLKPMNINGFILDAGVIMFAYVLVGLVCVFQAIRTKEGHYRGFYVTLGVIIFELIIGGFLMWLYIRGLGEKGVKVDVIKDSITITSISIACYVIGIITMFIASFKEKEEIMKLKK